VCVSSREATKCFCGASNCRGIIGSGKRSPLKSSRRKSTAAAKTKDKKKVDMFSDLFVSYFTALHHLLYCAFIRAASGRPVLLLGQMHIQSAINLCRFYAANGNYVIETKLCD